MAFVDDRHGWMTAYFCPDTALCRSALLRTADAGATWDLVRFPAGFTDTVQFVSATVGHAEGRYWTDDGGTTWTALRGPRG